MIYCVTQPLENYNVILGGNTVGLYMTYGYYPPLLNLIFLTTLTPFGYEKGTEIEPGKRIVQLLQEEKFFDTVDMSVGDKKVVKLLTQLSPIEFYDVIRGVDISHLPVCDYYSTGQEAVKMIVAARAVAWRLHFKGALESQGNVIHAAFGKEGIQSISSDMIQHHKEFVTALKKNRGGGNGNQV